MSAAMSFIMSKAIFLLMVFLALASCSDDSNDPFVITSETEYAVYRALIEKMYIDSDIAQIVIESKTVGDFTLPVYSDARTMIPFELSDLSVSQDTFDSIKNRNQQSEATDCAKLALSVPCVLLDQKALQELFTPWR